MGKRSRSPLAVLGLLGKTKLTGYAIKTWFSKPGSVYWNESYGQIYPALKSLVDLGLVEQITPEDASDAPRPTAKYYAITDAGQAELAKWLRKPIGTTSTRDEIALRVSFGEHVNPEIIRGLLESERDRVIKALEELQSENLDGSDAFRQMSSSWCSRYLDARLEWCDDCLTRLDELI